MLKPALAGCGGKDTAHVPFAAAVAVTGAKPDSVTDTTPPGVAVPQIFTLAPR
jgi:hypothetical protein